MRRTILAMVGTISLLGACGGGESGEVLIETVAGAELNAGTFTATGGVTCNEGTFENADFEFTDTLFTYDDLYTCDDGSGTFVVSAELPWDPDNEEPGEVEGTWTVGNGTGDYTDLTGSGTIVSRLFVDSTERYSGEMDRP